FPDLEREEKDSEEEPRDIARFSSRFDLRESSLGWTIDRVAVEKKKTRRALLYCETSRRTRGIRPAVVESIIVQSYRGDSSEVHGDRCYLSLLCALLRPLLCPNPVCRRDRSLLRCPARESSLPPDSDSTRDEGVVVYLCTGKRCAFLLLLSRSTGHDPARTHP
ncbi:hypothetical protein PENTCL1PPCAC_18348, partial [Pristionchus entomophagus]